MRETASVLLEDAGYRVLTARDGQECLTIFSEKRDEIDLVILDMLMPGLAGSECFDAMREIHPDVRVVLASGFSREGELDSMRAKGLKGYLPKPFNAKALYSIVQDALAP